MNSPALPISTRPARQTRWGRAICWLALGAAQAHAWAQDIAQVQPPAQNAVALLVTQCPAAFATPVPSLAQPAYLDKLAEQAEACDARADYFAHRGSLLLMAGRLSEAATNLEKALLLNPDLPGAQLDFAQALAQLGQKEAALQLVDQVGGRADIEPGLRQWLSSFNAQPKGEAWSWSAMLQSSLGHETNLDSATHTDTLTLYLSNGPVIVNLTDAERPRAGTGIKNWLAVQGWRSLGQGEVRVSAALQARNTPSTPLGNNYQTDGSLAYAQPTGPGVASIKLASLRYHKEDAYDYNENGVVFKYEPAWRLNQCPWALVWAKADQHHQSAPIMSGTYQQARLEGSCKNSTGGVSYAHISTGNDRAQDPTRPGGHKTRFEYGLRHDQPLVFKERPAQLSIWMRQHNSQDSDILSPLLGPKVVYTRRLDLGLGYWWRLNKQWSAGLDLEQTRQHSNNELSQLKNTVIYTGIRWSSD